MLLSNNYTFDNAEQALALIVEQAPGIIITDIVLQQMTGLELVENVLVAEYRPKILIVSGYNNFEYAQRGIKLGVTDYILKPFDKERFRQSVLGLIELILEERRGRRDREPYMELGTRALNQETVTEVGHATMHQLTGRIEMEYLNARF
ncbi:response regulator [Paenibacillus mendelii]|uniref:Response regulator n=1 Tax=Paenibacillus mendelii TaxID=206163 RepID=A0ABV6JAE8_9BACL|nr:response regulator [Paenibacillus mendelii]MCQ6560743.1 response regulator [Paenibacillus mendelii]